MRVHELKTDPDAYDDVAARKKTFELRFDDRGYEVGDHLVLMRTNYSAEQMKQGYRLEYTGLSLMATVTHILRGPAYGLKDRWAILSISLA